VDHWLRELRNVIDFRYSQALKDVDYVIKEKSLFEKLFDCELESISDAKGVFYFDNGHSFDKVLLYGNENAMFGFEFLLFAFLLFATGDHLIAALSIGIVFKVIISSNECFHLLWAATATDCLFFHSSLR